MEGGPVKPDRTEFTECWRTSWKTPYIMRLALSAGIGGLLFGYDTGNNHLIVFLKSFICLNDCNLQHNAYIFDNKLLQLTFM